MRSLMNWKRILPGCLANFVKKLMETPSQSKTGKRSTVKAGKGLEAGVPQALSKALPAAAAKLTSAFAQLPPRCLTVPHFVRVQEQFSLPTRGRPDGAG